LVGVRSTEELLLRAVEGRCGMPVSGVARLRKKDAQAEPLGVEYCQWWPRGTRSPESELVARSIPKPERRSVGVISFPDESVAHVRHRPASRLLSEPINELDAVIGTWCRESRLPLQKDPCGGKRVYAWHLIDVLGAKEAAFGPIQVSTTASACGAASATTDRTSAEYSSTILSACPGSVVDAMT
jgi:hypothetical protein